MICSDKMIFRRIIRRLTINRGMLMLFFVCILILIIYIGDYINKQMYYKEISTGVEKYIYDELDNEYLKNIDAEEGIGTISIWNGKLKIRYLNTKRCLVEGDSYIKADSYINEKEFFVKDYFVLHNIEGKWEVFWSKSKVN